MKLMKIKTMIHAGDGYMDNSENVYINPDMIIALHEQKWEEDSEGNIYSYYSIYLTGDIEYSLSQEEGKRIAGILTYERIVIKKNFGEEEQ